MDDSASRIRYPAVAGMFYPDDANELRSLLEQYLNTDCSMETPPRAIIAPHAGYIYSGPVAGSAYACLGRLHDQIHRVVLLGPSHRVAFRGIAASGADYFATPLGNIPIDQRS